MSDDSRSDAPAAPAADARVRRPLFDPESIPLDPQFDAPDVRGWAVPRDRLTPQALRARFLSPPVWQPEINTDGRLLNLDQPPRPAAVLVPLIRHGDSVSVLLTERTAHLHDHAGQISFPGGRVDDSDADAFHTALRETEEEIGLQPSAVEVIGEMPTYVTATSYVVTPVVGLVEPGFTLRLDTFEVAHAFEVPLAFLMDPANHERRRVTLGGESRTFYAMPYTTDRRHFIWGATAAMLRNFYQFLRA